MNSQELIKYLTQEFVHYVNRPDNERLQQRKLRRQQRGRWSNHFFGLIPFALFMMLRPLIFWSAKLYRFLFPGRKICKPSR